MRKTKSKNPRTWEQSRFFCTKCGNESEFPLVRVGNQRDPGHLKVLYCLHCKEENNMVEVRESNPNYTIDNFRQEYENGNFDEKGNRILPLSEFYKELERRQKEQRMANRKKIILMSGIQASGKSTYARQLAEEIAATYISRDEIRFSLLKPDDNYFAVEDEVVKQFIQSTQNAIDARENVICDATFLTTKVRNKFLRKLKFDKKDYEVVVIAVLTPLNICLERNAQREGLAKVPEEAVLRAYHTISTTKATEEEMFKYVDRYKIKGMAD